nr:MAG TPA: hypothetical protein [Caudoviricetes sp.]DAX79922.1 MAG TPA: hypothetical protein [Caudoviricetes sp.]
MILEIWIWDFNKLDISSIVVYARYIFYYNM